MFTVDFYKDAKGNSPVDEFLDDLKKKNFKLYVKTEKMMLLLEEKGNELTEPYSKHIEKGLFELRTIQGSNITRLFYFFSGGKIIIINHGFLKKTKKTPRKEIKKALKRKEEFERRENDERSEKKNS